MRLGLIGILAALAFAGAAQAVDAPRLALVVGNAAYEKRNWALKNPVRDAQAVATALEGVGFTVTVVTDATEADMDRALREFGRAIRQAGPETTALFFFAGHGMRADGVNWLLPIELDARVYEDVAGQGVRLGQVVTRMANAGARTSLVVVNACRDDPLPRATMSAQAGRGMIQEGEQDDVLIVYAAAPGQVALDYWDESDTLSPFTRAFLNRLRDPEPVQLLFGRIRGDVLDMTNSQQRPFVEHGLSARSAAEDFYFVPASAPVEGLARGDGGVTRAEAVAFAAMRTCADVEAFLERFPDGALQIEAIERRAAACRPDEPAAPPASALGPESWVPIVRYVAPTCFSDEEDLACGFSHAAWSPDGRMLAVADNTGGLFVGVDGRLRPIAEPAHEGGISAITWEGGGQLIATAGFDDALSLWSVRTRERTATWAAGDLLVALNWDGRDTPAGLDFEGGLVFGCRIGGGCTRRLPSNTDGLGALRSGAFGVTVDGREALGLGFSGGGAAIVIGDADARFLGPSQPKAVNDGRSPHVADLAFSPDGAQVAVARFDGRASVHDVGTGALVHGLLDLDDALNTIDWSADGRRIVVATEDRALRVFDARSGLGVATIERAHQFNIADAAFSPNGAQIATASLDGTVQVWLRQD